MTAAAPAAWCGAAPEVAVLQGPAAAAANEAPVTAVLEGFCGSGATTQAPPTMAGTEASTAVVLEGICGTSAPEAAVAGTEASSGAFCGAGAP